MVIYLLVVGIISLIMGMLFLVSPQSVRDLSDRLNKTISCVDEKLFAWRIGTGVCLIMIAIFAFFFVYYIYRI